MDGYEFRERLRVWPSGRLREAVRYFAADYSQDQQAAIEAELERRALPIPERERRPQAGADLQDVTAGRAILLGWAGFWRRLPACVGAMLASLGLVSSLGCLLGIGAALVFAPAGPAPSAIAVVVVVVAFGLAFQVVSFFLSLSLARLFLGVARWERPRVAEAFSLRGPLLRPLLLWCLVSAGTSLAFAPIDLLDDVSAAAVSGAISLALQLLVFVLLLLVADRGLGPVAALAAFDGISRGYRARLAGYALVTTALPVVGVWVAYRSVAGVVPSGEEVLSRAIAAVLLLVGYAPAVGIGLASLYSAASGAAIAAARNGSETASLALGGRPVSPWLERGALALLLPASVFGGGGGPQLIERLATSLAWVDPWMVRAVVGGALGVPFLIGAVLLHAAHVRGRVVVLDDAGLLLDRGPRWPGTRVAWSEVSGFRITSQGIQLRLKGRVWTRWLGPLLPCADRQVHELTVVLEQRGIGRF